MLKNKINYSIKKVIFITITLLFIMCIFFYINIKEEQREAQRIIKNYLEYKYPQDIRITFYEPKKEFFMLDIAREIENNDYLKYKLEEENIYYYLNYYNLKLSNLLMKPEDTLEYDEKLIINIIEEIFSEIIEDNV